MVASSQNENGEGDGLYHLEDEQEQEQNRREQVAQQIKYVGILAALMAVVFIGILVFISLNNGEDPKVYTVDSSSHGVPEDCEGTTALCSEDTTTSVLQCFCGPYVFTWSDEDGGWLQST